MSPRIIKYLIIPLLTLCHANYTSADDYRCSVEMTVTNLTRTPQKVLFDAEGDKYEPWSVPIIVWEYGTKKDQATGRLPVIHAQVINGLNGASVIPSYTNTIPPGNSLTLRANVKQWLKGTHIVASFESEPGSVVWVKNASSGPNQIRTWGLLQGETMTVQGMKPPPFSRLPLPPGVEHPVKESGRYACVLLDTLTWQYRNTTPYAFALLHGNQDIGAAHEGTVVKPLVVEEGGIRYLYNTGIDGYDYETGIWTAICQQDPSLAQSGLLLKYSLIYY